jgi:ribonucleotide reductase beta subunit family protein with ferritin-like domain
MNENILTKSDKRYTLFPIKYWKIYEYAKKHQASEWKSEEIEYHLDLTDWNTKLTEQEKHFVKMTLAFFASSDGIVAENINVNFSEEVQIPEARMFYAVQEKMEWVHAETYSLFIDTYFNGNELEKQNIFNAMHTFPAISKMNKWSLKWMNRASNDFATRLFAFALVEGLFFSGPFCTIFWLKKRGLLPNLCISNEWISRDEALHTEFAALLHSTLDNKLSHEIMYTMLDEVMVILYEFVNDSLPVRLIGMNAEQMYQYLQYVADNLLEWFGTTRKFNVTNPFQWMVNIGLDVKTNFFEKTVTNYQQSDVMDTFYKRQRTTASSESKSKSSNWDLANETF